MSTEQHEQERRALTLQVVRLLRDADKCDGVTLEAMIHATGAMLGAAMWGRAEFHKNLRVFLEATEAAAKRYRQVNILLQVTEKLDPSHKVSV